MKTMIEVFKTNVEHQHQAMSLHYILSAQFPLHRIDFDTEDCDKVLRVEGKTFSPAHIIALMAASGYTCSILD